MNKDRRHLLRRFFSGLTEHAFFTRLGVADPALVDYLSDMLVRFVRCDDLLSLRGPTGRRFDQVADMFAEAQERQGEARRQIHRHIGDVTLFWTGVYPEIAERMRRKGRKDALINYPELGKKSYLIASTIPVEKEIAPTAVLQRLGHEFDLCVYGLSEVRRQWENESGESGLGVLIN